LTRERPHRPPTSQVWLVRRSKPCLPQWKPESASIAAPKKKATPPRGTVSAPSCELKTCTPATRSVWASGHFSGQTAGRDSSARFGVKPTGNRDAGKFAPDASQLATGCERESLSIECLDGSFGGACPGGHRPHRGSSFQLHLGMSAMESGQPTASPSRSSENRGRLLNLEIHRRCFPAVLFDLILEVLPLVERAQSSALDRGDVDEYVFAARLRLNKSVTLRRIEPLHGAARHFDLPSDDLG